jgi:hypothetical protein
MILNITDRKCCRYILSPAFQVFIVFFDINRFSLLIGILGYHHFGKLNLLDSFHMACMILTGMGPVEVMSTTGAKIFSSLFALYSGIAFLSITAVFFSPIVHRIMHILHVESNSETK